MYIVVDVAVLSILTSTVVELVNSDFVVSMTIDEVSLTLVTLKVTPAASSFGVHKVTIIAIDVAGNETEQLITVSVNIDLPNLNGISLISGIIS
jgi:hypothetical protein